MRLYILVYRKGTWTGQCVNYYSFAPVQYKHGLARTKFKRARKICAIDILQTKLDTFKHTLIPNGYPAAFIKHIMASSHRSQCHWGENQHPTNFPGNDVM